MLTGKEYGTGSSRDWAAKGPALLGVKAVIAESYERIHRSNLVGMGVLPLAYEPGTDRKSLGLTGRETFSISGIAKGLAPGGRVTVTARDESREGDRLPRDRAAQLRGGARLLPARRHPAARAPAVHGPITGETTGGPSGRALHRAGGPLPAGARARPRRDGASLSRARPQARPPGRPQGPRLRPRCRPRSGAFPARDPDGRSAPASQHPDGVRQRLRGAHAGRSRRAPAALVLDAVHRG